jgi:hypothetical protein
VGHFSDGIYTLKGGNKHLVFIDLVENGTDLHAAYSRNDLVASPQIARDGPGDQWREGASRTHDMEPQEAFVVLIGSAF